MSNRFSPVFIIVRVIPEKAFNSRSVVGLSVSFLLFSGCNTPNFALSLFKERRTTNSINVYILIPRVRGRKIITVTSHDLG